MLLIITTTCYHHTMTTTICPPPPQLRLFAGLQKVTVLTQARPYTSSYLLHVCLPRSSTATASIITTTTVAVVTPCCSSSSSSFILGGTFSTNNSCYDFIYHQLPSQSFSSSPSLNKKDNDTNLLLTNQEFQNQKFKQLTNYL